MKFCELMEKLQNENEGSIVLVKNGIFFVATGKDAIILNELIGLRLTCMRPGLCKVGFATKSTEKYMRKLNNTGKAYVMYLKKDNEELEELYRQNGEKVYEEKTCLDCEKCTQKAETEEDIFERIRNSGK